MKIQELRLRNFRQFIGDQFFDFSSDKVRPVSLIFGANGSGKTTLLNAFTWGLYGNLSEDVEEKDRLVTDSAWADLKRGDSIEVSVEITFSHEQEIYRLVRSAVLRKESDRQPPTSSRLNLWVTRVTGISEENSAPQATINSILPEGVSRFFFFNGERIENLVKKEAYREVKKDIKVLLDLEQVERALVRLPKVNRKFTDELKAHGGDKASAIQEAIDSLSDSRAKSVTALQETEENISTLTEDVERIEELLRKHSDAAPLQERRDAIQRELVTSERDFNSLLNERRLLVASAGFQAFTKRLETTTTRMSKELYEKGALPAPIKREFVDSLLEGGSCICGNSLEEHSKAWQEVTQWRQRAGLQAVESAWQRVGTKIESLNSARTELHDHLNNLIAKISSMQERLEKLRAKKSELDGMLKGSRKEEVQDLENRRQSLISARDKQHNSKGSHERAIADLDSKIEQKTRERSRASVTDELARKARARSELVISVKEALEKILRIREQDMRTRLDAELKEIFTSITHQAHVPRLNENFELSLHKNVGGAELPVAKSTGENQILSLSFVAAVSKLAREVRNERKPKGSTYDEVGTFPIVMDAAFGSLDQDYQEAVSRALAKMAPQLIVLVSKSQGLGKVVDELMPFVSNMGVIESHSTAEGLISDELALDGERHPYIVPSDSDYSILKEIK